MGVVFLVGLFGLLVLLFLGHLLMWLVNPNSFLKSFRPQWGQVYVMVSVQEMWVVFCPPRLVRVGSGLNTGVSCYSLLNSLAGEEW